VTRRDRATTVRVSAAATGTTATGQSQGVFHTQLAYELIQGPLVRWSTKDVRAPPPTAVLIHGILGSRRNLASFANKLAEAFPAWQFLLVDLRCHGGSHTDLALPPLGPHDVEASASDILRLLGQLKLFPRILIGHSFGGKVSMSMVKQFGEQSKGSLPRPVEVWVLDTVPGQVDPAGPSRQDHPADLIAHCMAVPAPIPSRTYLVDYLTSSGFSQPIARWMTTNLRPCDGGLEWGFDLDGIQQMYKSYEEADLWPVLEDTPRGANINFVRAQNSTFRWEGGNVERIEGNGKQVHLLENSGHWVHTDNPDGLFSIIAQSFVARA